MYPICRRHWRTCSGISWITESDSGSIHVMLPFFYPIFWHICSHRLHRLRSSLNTVFLLLLTVKSLSFPHVTHMTLKPVFHNGGKLSKTYIKLYLCGYFIVVNRWLHFYIPYFSTISTVLHNVNNFSTIYPLSLFCGNMWETIIIVILSRKSVILHYVEKKNIHNFDVDFTHKWL